MTSPHLPVPTLAGRFISLTTPHSGDAIAEFRVGLQSESFLADHAVQDAVILPGSLYIEMARRVAAALSPSVPIRIEDVRFHRAVVLGPDDIGMTVRVQSADGAQALYRFYDDDPTTGASVAESSAAATLTVVRAAAADGPESDAVPTTGRRGVPDVGTNTDAFYERLRVNGNQYGPAFRQLVSMSNDGRRVRGRIARAAAADRSDAGGWHPNVLDGLTQLLAAFLVDRGRAFVLQSIDRVDIRASLLPDPIWAEAEVIGEHGQDGSGLLGRVTAFDDTGRVCAELSGVALATLEPAPAADSRPDGTRVVVSANFTADPVEEVLQFWGEELSAPVRVEFAPYNQIYQQLLDPASAMAGNRDGANVVLVGLEEWASAGRTSAFAPSPERAARAFGTHKRCVLPNGLEVAHLNQYETDYLYKEIFEDRAYLRHGVELRDGATVVDIGANIGMFSLFVMQRCRDVKLYSFEPAPAVYELLKANCEAYSTTAHAVKMGVSDRASSARFTFYEHSSVFSGFHTDAAEDRAALETIVRNTLIQDAGADDSTAAEQATALVDDRLRATTYDCQLTSVSDIIRDHGIDRIDLLKIDAEKSEWDVLTGIAESDWPRIQQIVIEIHDRTRALVSRIETLLEGRGFRCVVEGEEVLRDSGLFNLYATRAPLAGPTTDASPADDTLIRAVHDLCDAAAGYARRGGAPLFLCVCPRTPAVRSSSVLAAALDDAEQRLLAALRGLPGVTAIDSATVDRHYHTADVYDPHGHRLGHIPYTSKGFAAIGSAVARAMFSTARKPFKVIALDCDNTLWRGVCAEDSAAGIELGPGYVALQAFMVRQMNAGMLLCLCSKNEEQDVFAVFDQRADMVLQREHLAAWRINWASKAENLRSVADELNLGLDSFIFIDDNPVECADMRVQCPAVLTLQLPENEAAFEPFLDHVWAFDHASATAEDRGRTRMYRENAKRQQFRHQIRSLKEFVEGLALRIEIGEATSAQLPRVSQLTFRTNQFNSTTIRRTEQELGEFVTRPGAHCLAVRVADRFGDYGLVGVVLYQSMADRLYVDTLLLSCRVLGRGVEHAIIAHLGRAAQGAGKPLVEFAFRPTARSAPVQEFLASLDPATHPDTGSRVFTAEQLALVEYDPDGAQPPTPADAAAPAPRQADDGTLAPSETLQRIAGELRAVDRIAEAVERFRHRESASETSGPGLATDTLEGALLDIWRRVLGNPRIGTRDNFFDVGGTSLRAVQVLASIRKELGRALSVVTLFECPTVALLAAKLRPTSNPTAPAAAPASASASAERGQRRRQLPKRRPS